MDIILDYYIIKKCNHLKRFLLRINFSSGKNHIIYKGENNKKIYIQILLQEKWIG